MTTPNSDANRWAPPDPAFDFNPNATGYTGRAAHAAPDDEPETPRSSKMKSEPGDPPRRGSARPVTWQTQNPVSAVFSATKAEFRKTMSTKIWWVLLLIGTIYAMFTSGAMSAAIGWVMDSPEVAEAGGLTVTGDPGAEGVGLYVMLYAIPASVGYMFPALLGAICVTTEYRNQTLTPTFLAEPHRGRVLIGKLLSNIPMGIIYAVVMLGLSGVLTAVFLNIFNQPLGLNHAEVWESVGRAAGALVLWTLVGVGIGTLIPNQIASIFAIIVFTQVLEPVLRMIPQITGKTIEVIKYLPGSSSDALIGGSVFTAGDAAAQLPGWAGGLMLGGYALVFLIVGFVTQFRRDVS